MDELLNHPDVTDFFNDEEKEIEWNQLDKNKTHNQTKECEENKNLGSQISVWEKLDKERYGNIRNDDGENKKKEDIKSI